MIYQGDPMEYIYETPAVLQNILEHEKSILKETELLLKEKEISEIYLTGSGSSYNAAEAAAVFAKKLLGIRITPVYPVTLMADCEMISPKALVLGISQQGTSLAVIRAMDQIRKKGIAVISVTGEQDTEIIRHGDAKLYVECGYEDAGATTKGYTATILTLLLFVIMTAEKMEKIAAQEADIYRKRIETLIRNMEQVLRDSRLWCERSAEKLKSSTDLIIVASSNLKSLLLEGILKFSETCRFPVRGYEAEEFMHGMYNAVTERTDFLYLFPADGYELQRMERLFEYYERQGVCQYAVNMPESGEKKESRNKLQGAEGMKDRKEIKGREEMENGVPQAESEKNVLSCRFINDPDFSILEYTLPLQMLFVRASRKRGINLNRPRDPEFHKYMGSKLEEEDHGETN